MIQEVTKFELDRTVGRVLYRNGREVLFACDGRDFQKNFRTMIIRNTNSKGSITGAIYKYDLILDKFFETTKGVYKRENLSKDVDRMLHCELELILGK